MAKKLLMLISVVLFLITNSLAYAAERKKIKNLGAQEVIYLDLSPAILNPGDPKLLDKLIAANPTLGPLITKYFDEIKSKLETFQGGVGEGNSSGNILLSNGTIISTTPPEDYKSPEGPVVCKTGASLC